MVLSVRSYQPGDAAPLGQVFYQSVREGARHRYSDAQVQAWGRDAPRGEAWAARLEAVDTIVAVYGDDVVGFMTLDDAGYVDLAFVVPKAMGTGVSDALYAVLEGRARAAGTRSLTTQASLMAEPFFARHGWQVTKRQKVEIRGVFLDNAWMEKRLQRLVA